MKRLVIVLLVFALLTVSGCSNISTPENTVEIVMQMIKNYKDGQNTTTFRNKAKLDDNEIFSYLESIYPMAFGLQISKYADGRVKLKIEMVDESKQRRGEIYARNAAKSIITDDMTIKQRLRAIHDYIVLNSEYDIDATKDQDENDPYTVYGLMFNKKAVCSGYSRAFAIMCDEAGIDVLYVSDEGMDHGFSMISYYGKMMFIDTTYDDPVPDVAGAVSHAYFMKDRAYMENTHTWDKSLYSEIYSDFFPEDFKYIQIMQDFGVIDREIRAINTYDVISESEYADIYSQYGFESNSNEDRTYADISKELYEYYGSVDADGTRPIDKLVSSGRISLDSARDAGF